MDAIVAALAEQHAELETLLAGLDDAGWRRPSRCEGWSVADVVLHLAQTDEMALASAEGRLADAMTTLAAPGSDVDEGADRMVQRDRGAPPAEILARWRASSTALRHALLACDPHARLHWVAGDLSARTLATTRLAESWIHTGDVADALGVDLDPPARLWHVVRLAWRTLPYAFARAGRTLGGPVAFELVGPGREAWDFVPDDPARTSISGDALELCLVAARRVDPARTGLTASGPDGDAVLELVRTYA